LRRTSLVVSAWALLLCAWVVGNAPFASPDEPEHFVRAIGVSTGHLIGRREAGARTGGATAIQLAWTAQAARVVSLPADLNPEPFTCDLGPGEHDAACQNAVDPRSPPVTLVTAVGNYQPLPYLLPALALRAGHSASSALRLARAAAALLALGLLAVALFALYDAQSPRVSILGLLLAVTPMVLFCAASLNGSGTEIAGAVAFFSCLLRVSRPGSTGARWWTLTAISGAVLALSRSSGPAWLVLLALVALGWSGARAFAHRWTATRAPRVAAIVLVLAVALNRIWESLYGSHTPLDTSQLHAGLVAGAHEWWKALTDLVGKFGYVDVRLPLIVPVVWLGLVAALLASAVVVSRGRQLRALAALTLTALVGPTVFYALIIRPTGFGLQGRHVLPLLVALPLLAGEAVYRNRERIRASWLRALAAAIPPAVAVMQAIAWYVNARRYAVGGTGPGWFLPSAAWAPPGGWWVWLVTVALASACLGSLALAANREPEDQAREQPRGEAQLVRG
jgi:hypothetical protein